MLVPGDIERKIPGVDPDTIPPVTIFFDDFLLVTNPVLIPLVDCS